MRTFKNSRRGFFCRVNLERKYPSNSMIWGLKEHSLNLPFWYSQPTVSNRKTNSDTSSL